MDLSRAWAVWSERLQPRPRHALFGRDLLRFPPPVRGALPDPLPEVAILTPCRDAEALLPGYFALIDALDYPRRRLHLRLLEGDSRDATRAAAGAALASRGDYASAGLLKLDLEVDLGGGSRRRVGVQRARRAAIAACRNRLLQAGLETGAAWLLFVDVDMAAIPPGLLREMLAWNAPVSMPNCLRARDDVPFDLNAFTYLRPPSDRAIRRYAHDGIYQPPKGYFRAYPDPAGDPAPAPLDGVGGTVLLIRRDVAEAEADFPEVPYRWHIETEGFALKAADLGFGAWMLPRLIVRHGEN